MLEACVFMVLAAVFFSSVAGVIAIITAPMTKRGRLALAHMFPQIPIDIDGDGTISAKEFRQGMAALNLHLRFDEIDDLM